MYSWLVSKWNERVYSDESMPRAAFMDRSSNEDVSIWSSSLSRGFGEKGCVLEDASVDEDPFKWRTELLLLMPLFILASSSRPCRCGVG
jgi:hypothetical protein